MAFKRLANMHTPPLPLLKSYIIKAAFGNMPMIKKFKTFPILEMLGFKNFKNGGFKLPAVSFPIRNFAKDKKGGKDDMGKESAEDDEAPGRIKRSEEEHKKLAKDDMEKDDSVSLEMLTIRRGSANEEAYFHEEEKEQRRKLKDEGEDRWKKPKIQKKKEHRKDSKDDDD